MIRYLPLIEFKSPTGGNAETFALGSDDLACGFFAQRLVSPWYAHMTPRRRHG